MRRTSTRQPRSPRRFPARVLVQSKCGRSGRSASRDRLTSMSASRIETTFRAEAGRVLATLIRLVGDFEYAEDAMQEAFTVALTQWSETSIPDNPRAWLVNVARHKVIDRFRRQTSFQHKQRELEAEVIINSQPAPDEAGDAVLDDDMLRLIFTCCHPALNIDVQVALTLRAI